MGSTFQDMVNRLAAQRLLRLAMEFPTEEARKQYLKDHPNADPKKHTVKDDDGDEGGKGEAKEDPDVPKNLTEKLTSFWGSVKGWSKEKVQSVREKVEAAPKHVQAFVSDPEYRAKKMEEGVKAAKAAPKQFASHVWDTFTDEIREKKSGLTQGVKLISGKKKWKDLSDDEKEDFKATAFDLTTTTIFFVASGGLAGATSAPMKVAGKALVSIGKDFAMGMGQGAATKVFSETVDNLGKMRDGLTAAGIVGKGAMKYLGPIAKAVLKASTGLKVSGEDAEAEIELSDEQWEKLLGAMVMDAALKHAEVDDDAMTEALGKAG
jgi:flagellar motor protein MotB